jgi:hypothetical protein
VASWRLGGSDLEERVRWGETGISAGMAAVAVAFYGLATFTQNINPVDPGPAFYPRIISVLLLAAAVVQLALSWKDRRAAGTERRTARAGGVSPYRYSVGTCVLSVVYVALFDRVNYLLSAGLLLAALMLLGGVRRWPILVGVSVCYAAATYFLFGRLLMVPLP